MNTSWKDTNTFSSYLQQTVNHKTKCFTEVLTEKPSYPFCNISKKQLLLAPRHGSWRQACAGPGTGLDDHCGSLPTQFTLWLKSEPSGEASFPKMRCLLGDKPTWQKTLAKITAMQNAGPPSENYNMNNNQNNWKKISSQYSSLMQYPKKE